MMAPTQDTRTDSELLSASVHDPTAFEELFARHACEIRAWLVTQTSDIGDANELLAETFAQAWRSRRRFSGTERGDGLAWIYGIARNLLRRHYKRGRVERHARARLGMSVSDVEQDYAHDVIARVSAADMRPRITAALDALPDGQQRAIDARILRELDYPAVAAELGCTEPTARALVSRGLRKLNSTLKGAQP